MSSGSISLKASTGGTVSVRKINHQLPAHFPQHPPSSSSSAAAAAAAAAAAGAGGAPEAALLPGAAREWRASLCDMSAPPGGEARCLAAHLCWVCLAGEVAERTGGSYLLDGLIGGTFGCLTCLYAPLWALTRYRLRQRLGIAGHPVEDLLVAGCCPPCYLAQSLNELDLATNHLPGSPYYSPSSAAVAQAQEPSVFAQQPHARQGGVRADALAAAAEAARTSGAAK